MRHRTLEESRRSPFHIGSGNMEPVVADLSGFGTGGPMRNRKAYDMLVQAEAGLIAVTGTPETAVKTGIPTADLASGMYVPQAVLAALLRRCRTGEGVAIEESMLEATVEGWDTRCTHRCTQGRSRLGGQGRGTRQAGHRHWHHRDPAEPDRLHRPRPTG